MDGELGALVRARDRQAPACTRWTKQWDNGYRQMTSSHQADQDAGRPQRLQDPRARRARCGPSMFKAFGAVAHLRSTSPRSIRRCRPRLSTARRTRWRSSTSAKLYEVQKYLSVTNHMWDGFWFLANAKRAWEALPADVRDIIEAEPQRLRDRAARRHRQAERHPVQARSEDQGHGVHRDRPDAVPRQAEVRRLLRGVEEASSATRPGAVLEKYAGAHRLASGVRIGHGLAQKRRPAPWPPLWLQSRRARRLARPHGRGAGRAADRAGGADSAGRRDLSLTCSAIRSSGRTSWPRSCSSGSPCSARGGVAARRAHAHVDAGCARAAALARLLRGLRCGGRGRVPCPDPAFGDRIRHR